MDRYRNFREVQATKIHDIVQHPDGIFLIPQDQMIGRIKVDRAFLASHQPSPGGYYVVKENGIRCFIHATEFESEYHRV